MTPKELKNSILQLAIEGKLVEQRKEEGSAEILYAEIQKEKQKLIKQGKIKKEKELSEITDDEIPFEIPKSWKWVRLVEVGSWGSGATPSKSEDKYFKNGNVPWLLTGDLNDGYINNSPQYITKLALEKTSVRLNPKGSVLIAMYGATIGKLGILNIEATTNQACCACQTFKGIYNKYLFYFLMAYKKKFTEKAEGGAQPNISKEKIINTQFSLPPLAEQKRIVEKIEELMPLVDRYEVLYDKLNALNKEFPNKLKNAVLQKAIEGKLVPQIKSEGTAEDLYAEIQKEKQKLVKQGKIKKEKELPEITDEEIPFEIPKSWKWCRINSCFDMYTGNSISENVKKSKYMKLSKGYNYIGTKDVSFEQEINYNNGVKIPYNEGFKRAEKGSVLMCIEGGSAGRKIAITNEEICFGNKLCKFNQYTGNNKYIFYYLQSPQFIEQFKENLTGIIGGVSIQKIKEIMFPLPPQYEQKRIVKKIEEILPYIEKLEKYN